MKRIIFTGILATLMVGVAFGAYSDSYIWNSIFSRTDGAIILYAVSGYTPGPHGGTGYSPNYIMNQVFDPTNNVIRVGVAGGGISVDTVDASYLIVNGTTGDSIIATTTADQPKLIMSINGTRDSIWLENYVWNIGSSGWTIRGGDFRAQNPTVGGFYNATGAWGLKVIDYPRIYSAAATAHLTAIGYTDSIKAMVVDSSGRVHAKGYFPQFYADLSNGAYYARFYGRNDLGKGFNVGIGGSSVSTGTFSGLASWGFIATDSDSGLKVGTTGPAPYEVYTNSLCRAKHSSDGYFYLFNGTDSFGMKPSNWVGGAVTGLDLVFNGTSRGHLAYYGITKLSGASATPVGLGWDDNSAEFFVNASQHAQAYASIIPGITSTYSLGKPDSTWLRVCADTFRLGATRRIYDDGTNIVFTPNDRYLYNYYGVKTHAIRAASSDQRLTLDGGAKGIGIYGHIVPMNKSTYSFGKADTAWLKVCADTFRVGASAPIYASGTAIYLPGHIYGTGNIYADSWLSYAYAEANVRQERGYGISYESINRFKAQSDSCAGYFDFSANQRIAKYIHGLTTACIPGGIPDSTLAESADAAGAIVSLKTKGDSLIAYSTAAVTGRLYYHLIWK